MFRAAVERAGGVVAPLSEDTRGLIWLTYARADQLSATLEANPQILWVQLPWAGVDAFAAPVRDHARADRVFTSAKGAYAQPVAEHALGMIIALLRAFPRRARLTAWDERIIGTSLYARRVTIVGAGGIARELMRLLAPFNVSITIVRRTDHPVADAEQTLTADRLPEVLGTTDVLVIAAAHTAETTHLISTREFERMKPEAVVVNIARGPLIDGAALEHALRNGVIAGAALDVTDPEPLPEGHPLWSAPNILITPHQADTPEMTAPLLAVRIEHNVRAFLGDGRFVGVVDSSAGY
ncbi:MAG: D-isomer specific 2-hydroxyacid dehydrogenase family protein [Aurantimicrobium sp.]|nr:D-isomer specific 2-hydroxyacid dehydrogenase family protein [Aurantimicrobium sp.]